MIPARGNARALIPILWMVLAGVALLLFSCTGEGVPRESEQQTADVWTCSMHPQVRQDGPGDCPICGMDLIPVEGESSEEELEERQLSVSEAGRKLMEIETATAERKMVHVEVGLVGKITYDEGRVARISAWVPGRIERLYVDYVGYEVREGEPMVELYGPRLVAAQQELIQSSDAHAAVAASGRPRLVESTLATLDAVRERLRLWGLSDVQIQEIEDRGTADSNITILAPMGGTVVAKDLNEGQYVKTGQTLFTIADLSVVWVELAAYESDLPWLAEGQVVEFSVEALPGETFTGTISLIEPTVDPMTRTVTVRAEIDNEDGSLRPNMFVRASVEATAHGPDGGAPLVIPATAALLTGERAVVYVQVEGAERPTYEGREVVLGPRAGDYYVVVSGLAQGDRVVTEGAFKIDSALQIRAKPSMMNPQGEEERPAAQGGGHAGH